ncbi:hypothetical protein [Metabacillus sp. Hm71]|uniref:hypothetical protein n=1 Tax=Metabacillus sp. Hm71 TaxID=3450743 RepID=UPI003F42C36E
MRKIIKIPNYDVFVQYLFDNMVVTWNPKEHESWELPPSWLLECFYEIFPLNEKSEVVDFMSPASEKRIEQYFGLNSV